MPPSEVRVAYTLYPSGSGDSQAALEGVSAQFPSRNSHWKSSTRPTLRTMQEVDVRLVDSKDVPPGKETVAGSVLESPLVHVCFVCCDDPDVYKNNTKTFIKDWLSLSSSRRASHVPMIVLVNPSSSGHTAASSKNVFGRDRGIIAKLRTDFNNNKRDICAQSNLPIPGTTDPAAWPDVINKSKESIVSAFDAAIIEREDEVKRGESQKVTVGWNFSTWFLLKESLAHSFEGVNSWEDASIIYEELEASFLQALKDQNLSWFDKLGGTDENDDSLPILDIGAKRYRDMSTQSAISVFDFRIYLFACQCKVLGKSGRVTEIAKRGQWFVASLARRLRENQSELPQFFIESWTYSACMDSVARCDEWSRVDRPNNDYSGSIAYESARAELSDIARVQAERIGVEVGFLPDRYPFKSATALKNSDMSFKKTVDGDAPKFADRPSSNPVFVDALKSKDTFTQLYIDLTNQALQAYEACGKVNSAVRSKTDLAALASHMEDYDSAYILCRNSAYDCADSHVWDPVSKFALVGALKAHAEMQRPQDDDWAHMAVAYSDVCSGSLSAGTDVGQSENVINGSRDASEARQVKDTIVFKLRSLDNVARVSESDPTTTELTVEVNNTSPIAVDVDNVWLELESDAYGVLSYGSGPVRLEPGRQSSMSTCATSISGAAILRDGCVVLRNIAFMAPFPADQSVVPIQRSPSGIRAALHMPAEIALDEEPRVVLDVKSGEHASRNVRVSVASLQDEVSYDTERTTGEDSGEHFNSTEGFIAFGDIDADKTVTVTFPYQGVPRNELARARITIEYESKAGRSCRYIDDQAVFMGLPITVNVQDFFRPDELVSSYSIASDGREYIRVGSVDLQSGSEGIYQIQPCREKWEEPILISPSQPSSCLFKIQVKGDPTGEMLRSAIKYQTVDEELLHSAEQASTQSQGQKGVQALARLVRVYVTERGDWLQPYSSDGDLGAVFGPKFEAALGNAVPSSAVAAFSSAVSSQGPAAPQWRTLRIPVDVPLGRLSTSVTLTPSSPTTIYEGRAMAFKLSSNTSVAWSGKSSPPAYRVSYDVQPSADDWVVVGKKRGVYVATPGEVEEQELVLVPVRYGTSASPPISVQLLDRESAQPGPERVSCETYGANAAQGIKVLPARTGMAALVPVQPDWAE